MVKCHQDSSLLLRIIPEIQLEISVKNKVNNMNRGNISRTHAVRTDDTMSRLITMRSTTNYWRERAAFQLSAFGRSTAGNDVVATIIISLFLFFFSPFFFFLRRNLFS